LQLASGEGYGCEGAAMAVELRGDEQYANVMLLGAAYQPGAVPVAAETIERAIRLNGTAVEANIAAFRHGRNVLAQPAPEPAPPQSLDALIDARAGDLVAYQSAAYAADYRAKVERVRAAEETVLGTEVL